MEDESDECKHGIYPVASCSMCKPKEPLVLIKMRDGSVYKSKEKYED